MYIGNVFDNVCFINIIVRYAARLVGMDLGVDNNFDRRVKLFKNMIKYIYQSTRVMTNGFICASPLGREEASVLYLFYRIVESLGH